jgi:hypothetical protein
MKKHRLSIKYTHYVNSSERVWLLHCKCMQFIQGINRNQTYFATLEDQVSKDNPVRLTDAFIDKLDLSKLGFINTMHKSEGRPPYAAAVLLKLYL